MFGRMIIRHKCPFCGNTPFISAWNGCYQYCCGVHLEGPYAGTREQAWEKWCDMVEKLWERDKQ